jgi:tetratricopeptide (TPR) repeat protein
MARFDKLEFEDSRQQDDAAEPSLSTRRDEIDWMQRADQQRRTGLYENALKYYSRALELDKTLIGGWLGQVQMLVQLGEYPEAELWARKSLELFPSHGDLMAARSQALCRLGDIKRAHEMGDGSLKQSGQSAYRWMVRGELLLAARQATDQHCFDKAQQLDADWLISAEIALIYLFYRNPSRAQLRARRACETAPEQYYAWLIQARCQRALGLDSQARRSLQTCLELCPGHAEARHLLAQLESTSVSSVGRWLRSLFQR